MSDRVTTPKQCSELEVGDRYDELAATIALIRSEVVPAAHLGVLIDESGSAVRLVQLSEADRLMSHADPTHGVIGSVTEEDITRAQLDLASWQQSGLDVRCVLDQAYPAPLHDIFNRPALVFVRGAWPMQPDRPTIAVVGNRAATDDGLRRARRVASELVEAGFAVLSGLAAGIDTAAHTSALDAGGQTAAVMGTGLSRIFPAENEPLAERILAHGGVLLSQFFPSQPPTRWTFPMRNIVMSGLSLATVVVEASKTSGARMQARVALQHGRTVFLLKSLVEQHEWARKYVSEGAHGMQAIEIASTQDIVARLESQRGSGGHLAVA